jgi:hypothetical protein
LHSAEAWKRVEVERQHERAGGRRAVKQDAATVERTFGVDVVDHPPVGVLEV